MPSRALLCFLLTATAAAQAPFCAQIKALTQDPLVAQAHWGISVTTLDGAPLCGINDGQLFRPASNAKLFTATAGLALLGPAKTFTTTLVSEPLPEATPSPEHINLRLIGDGDAFLSTRPVPYVKDASSVPVPLDPLALMADAVAATGLHHITGALSAEDNTWPAEPFGPDWSIDDAVWGYGAPVSALTVYDNKLALTVHPGPTIGSPATVTFSPDILFAGQEIFQLDVQVTTVAAKAPAALNIERTPGSTFLRVYGTIGQGHPYSDDVAIPDPPTYAGLTLKSMLASRGIGMDGGVIALTKAPSDASGFQATARKPLPELASAKPRPPAPLCTACTVLFTHTSPTLLEDVTITLKVSQNLHAELLFHHLGEAFADDASSAQSARVVRQFAVNAGLKPTDFLLYDGSGLSGHDLVAPRAFTQLLAYAARQLWFPGFKAALPIGGVDGSLASRFTGPLKGTVYAKTGTLGQSRALSGYLTANSGQTLIFSVLVDNHPTQADRPILDQIVSVIAAQN